MNVFGPAHIEKSHFKGVFGCIFWQSFMKYRGNKSIKDCVFKSLRTIDNNVFGWVCYSMWTRLERAHCLETINNMWFLGKRECQRVEESGLWRIQRQRWIEMKYLPNGTRCCTLRRAKNTPTRSFVSNLYISQYSLPENAVKTWKILKSHGKQEVDVR